MYFRILKKDLKRKRTMNVILLLFVILADTFIASSVDNIITVSNGVDYYFEQAGVLDFLVITMNKAGGESVVELLDDLETVERYQTEKLLYPNGIAMFHEGEKACLEQPSVPILQAIENAELNYFDAVDNQVLEQVKPGEIYVVDKYFQENNMAIGDSLEIQLGDAKKVFRIAGSFKDAIGGSRTMSLTRFLVSEEDYGVFLEDSLVASMYTGEMIYIDVGDEEVLNQELGSNSNIVYMGNMKQLKMSYVMDMVVAGILVVVSVCLILIAFVVLWFVISSGISEEYREIGVMKAIGISNTRIRGLYMIKYLILATLGVVIGFFISIPFGHIMLETVSGSMVMNSGSDCRMNLLSSILLLMVIQVFCYVCTGKVKHYTPVDAIRSGTTGERFRKKGFLHLNRSRLHPVAFLAANDVCSSPRQFGLVTIAFTLSLSLVLILAISVSTLKSDGLITIFGVLETDAYYVNEGGQKQFLVEGGRAALEQELDRMEANLREHGIPAECMVEAIMNSSLVYGEVSTKAQVLQGIGTRADQYNYYEGTPPQNDREIAITKTTADKLGAGIGDTIIIRHAEGDREYVITAFFQSMINMGDDVRLHESAQVDFLQVMGFLPFQIQFTDHPDAIEWQERMELIQELYDTEEVYSAGEYAGRMTGVGDVLNNMKLLVLSAVLVIIFLVTVLMERSFIAREQGEIAILKAIGFRSSTMIAWHCIRFGIASMIAMACSLLLVRPLTEIAIGPIFRMMGAESGVQYTIQPLEVYVIYPCIVLTVTMLGACLTALYTRRIQASDTSSIE